MAAILKRQWIGYAVFYLLAIPALVFFMAVKAPALESSTIKKEFSSETAATKGAPAPEFVPDEILVKFKSGVPEHRKDDLHAKHGSRKIKEYRRIGVQRIKLTDDLTVEEALRRYLEDPDVLYAEPNSIVRTFTTTPNDPYYNTWGSWGQSYRDMWGLYAINAGMAWDLHRGSSSVVVAVPDTGLDFYHPDISGKIWTNPGEIPGNGNDDDLNGYVDDVNGWNFINETPSPIDDNGHGTHVSGTIAAATNNGRGIAGVSWYSKIMPLKHLGPDGTGNSGDGIESIIYAVENGAKVINCSWGGGSTQAGNDAVAFAYQSGALVVAAAGNSGAKLAGIFPAAHDNVLSVAATNVADTRADFSNYGPLIEVAAPGVDILSLAMGGRDDILMNSFSRRSGTSMAAPHAAGLAALLYAAHPTWSAAEVLGRIVGTTDYIGEQEIGTGRINAYKALGPGSSATVLRFVGHRFDDGNGNGDGLINPGESFNILVKLWNISAPALGVQATLSTNDPSITILNGTVNFGDLATGARVEGPPFQIIAPNVSYIHKMVFNLTVTAAGFGQVASGTIEDWVITNLPGWPAALGSGPYQHPALADITGDGVPELVVGGDKVYALTGAGIPVSGWPQAIPSSEQGYGQDAVAVGDLEGDGSMEIVFKGRNQLFAWRSDGTPVPGFPFYPRPVNPSDPMDSTYLTGLVLADLDQDGDLEIITASHYRTSVYVFHHDGSAANGWPSGIARDAYGNIYEDLVPAVGDLDGDGDMEVVMPTSAQMMFAWHHDGSGIYGWPVVTTNRIYGTPVLADLDIDGKDEVVAATSGCDQFGLYVYRGNGAVLPGWPRLGWAPSLGDLDGDGRLEIVAPYGYEMYAYKTDGTLLPNWPVESTHYLQREPLVGDIDGDGAAEVLTRGYGDIISAWNGDGSVAPNFPFLMTGRMTSSSLLHSLALGDINGDGLIDMVAGPVFGTTTFNAYPLPGAMRPDRLHWPMYRANAARTGKHVFSFPIITPSLPPGMKDVPYSAKVWISGGRRPYAWSMIGGALPEGLAFDGATGIISGIPTTPGNSQATFMATDALGQTAIGSYLIPVYETLLITVDSLPGGTYGTPYQQTLSTVGGLPPYTWSLAGGSLPSGLALDAAGVISGTPTVPGSYYFVVQVTDAAAFSTIMPYIVPIADTGSDLVVSALTVPATGAAGQSVSITDTVTNNGSGGAGAFSVKFYLSTNDTYDAADVLLGSRTVAGLDRWTSNSATVSVVIPAGTAVGAYTVIAFADADQAVNETSENNNTLGRVIKIGPDLIIYGMALPPSATPGSKITILESTHNVGAASSGASTTKYFLSSDAIYDGLDIYLGKRSVMGLAPGSWSSSGDLPLTIPAGTPQGSYFLIAVADAFNRVAESDEGNNTLGRPLGVGFPDLVVSQLWDPPATGTAGTYFNISLIVTNIGSFAVPDNSLTQFRFSIDNIVSSDDPIIGQSVVLTLAPGASENAGIALILPATLAAGTYYLAACADGTGLIPESNEENNCRVSTTTVVIYPASHAPSVSTSTLPAGRVGRAYTATLEATGGITPYTWSIASGSLPAGLSLNPGGVISGVPTTSGTKYFTVRVTDAASQTATKYMALKIR